MFTYTITNRGNDKYPDYVGRIQLDGRTVAQTNGRYKTYKGALRAVLSFEPKAVPA